jgi:hypothetical protein
LAESDHEENEEQDELDTMAQRIFGTRRSERPSMVTRKFGFLLNTSDRISGSSSSE